MLSVKESLTFFTNFLRDPEVASVVPTSGIAVHRICKKMNFGARRVFVEYGPGTGPLSRGVLERMTPDSRLILIDRNKTLVAYLREHMRDPRVSIHHDTAENVEAIVKACRLQHADYVLSSIPFSRLPVENARAITQSTANVLAPDGAFIAYQFLPVVGRYMRETFQEVDRSFILWNFPPLLVYEARNTP